MKPLEHDEPSLAVDAPAGQTPEANPGRRTRRRVGRAVVSRSVDAARVNGLQNGIWHAPTDAGWPFAVQSPAEPFTDSGEPISVTDHDLTEYIRRATAARSPRPVSIPPGLWQCSPISLGSGVRIHLHGNATLRFVPRGNHPAIRIEDAQDVAITGGGRIDFAGKSSPLISVVRGERVTLDGVSLMCESASAAIRASDVDRLTINAVQVHSPCGQGVRLSAAKQTLLNDVRFDVLGECVSIAADRAAAGLGGLILRRLSGKSRSAAAIDIDLAGKAALVDALIESCSFESAVTGLRINLRPAEVASLERVCVREFCVGESSGDVIELKINEGPGGRATMRDVHIDGVRCAQAGGAIRFDAGADSLFERLALESLEISSDEGLRCQSVRGLWLKDVVVHARTGPAVSLRDSQHISILGSCGAGEGGVFLDVRGRQTRAIRFDGESADHRRPTVVIGIDVPRDAILYD